MSVSLPKCGAKAGTGMCCSMAKVGDLPSLFSAHCLLLSYTVWSVNFRRLRRSSTIQAGVTQLTT